MTTALYRINGGEVLKISPTNQTFAQRDPTYWAVVTDPPFPDGMINRSGDGDGPPRELGFAKIFDAGTVRNATAPELTAFAAAETVDENLQDRDGARALFDTHPRFRKMMVAFADIVKDEVNILRGWTVDYKAAVAAASNLAQLKASVAALPTLGDRTLLQLKTAMLNRINEDD